MSIYSVFVARFLFFICFITKLAAAQDIGTNAAVPKIDNSSSRAVIYANGSVTAPDVSAHSLAAFGGAGFGFLFPRAYALFELHKGTNDQVGASFDSNGNIHSASKSSFGHTILDPESGGTSITLKTFWYSKKDLLSEAFPRAHIRWTIGIDAIRSDLMWSYTDKVVETLERVHVTTLALTFCAGLMNSGQIAGRSIVLYLRPCVSFRSIEGAVAQSDKDLLRASLIGTTDRAFVGPEIHVGFQIGGNLEIGMRTSYLFGGGGIVDGLSGFRVIPTILGTVPVSRYSSFLVL